LTAAGGDRGLPVAEGLGTKVPGRCLDRSWVLEGGSDAERHRPANDPRPDHLGGRFPRLVPRV